MVKKISLMVLVGLIVMGVAGSAPAVVITTATGSNGADAFVRFGGGAGDNNGAYPAMLVRYGWGSSATDKAYARFDLAGVDLASVTGATVTFTSLAQWAGGSAQGGFDANHQGPHVFSVWGLLDGSADNWGEYTITSPSDPASGGGSYMASADPSSVYGGTPLAQFSILGMPADQTQFVFSSPALVDFLKTDTNGKATFVLTADTYESALPNQNADGYEFWFAAKENGSAAPSLEIVPEPATLGLLLMGGLSLLARRSRRTSV